MGAQDVEDGVAVNTRGPGIFPFSISLMIMRRRVGKAPMSLMVVMPDSTAETKFCFC